PAAAPEPMTPAHEAMEVADGSSTAIVPTLTDLLEEQEDRASAVAVEPGPSIDDAEIEVEFGADELGAAAPREAVRVEEPQALVASASPAAFDVAALRPELPPDTVATPEPEFVPAPAPALPPGREPQVQERQEFARVDAELLDNLLNNAGEVSIFR